LKWSRQVWQRFIEGLPPLVKILGHIGRLKRRPERQGRGCGFREISM
jgi:hypothetical protein